MGTSCTMENQKFMIFNTFTVMEFFLANEKKIFCKKIMIIFDLGNIGIFILSIGNV